jgi:hypothetical protein
MISLPHLASILCVLCFVLCWFILLCHGTFSVLLYYSVLLCCSLLFILLCSSCYVCVLDCVYCTLTLPPGVNPIAVNIYLSIYLDSRPITNILTYTRHKRHTKYYRQTPRKRTKMRELSWAFYVVQSMLTCLHGRQAGIPIPTGEIFSSPKVQDTFGAHPASHSMCAGDTFRGGRVAVLGS